MPSSPVELAIVIPTLNERDNVPLVVERLNRVLASIAWEAVFVDDDSADGRRGGTGDRSTAARTSAACSASAGAGSVRPASRASCRAPRPMPR
jgi:hypothetical protein